MSRQLVVDVIVAVATVAFLLGIVVGRVTAAPRAVPVPSAAAASTGVIVADQGRTEAPLLAVGASPTPTVTARAQPRPTIDPTAIASESGATLAGPASWYCGQGDACTTGYPPSCACAAAGLALRVGYWRGRWLTVTYRGHSIRVQLVDFCGCPRGRIVDLYSSQFAELAPLSRGVIPVSVAWS